MPVRNPSLSMVKKTPAICVFCGSQPGRSPRHAEMARELEMTATASNARSSGIEMRGTAREVDPWRARNRPPRRGPGQNRTPGLRARRLIITPEVCSRL